MIMQRSKWLLFLISVVTTTACADVSDSVDVPKLHNLATTAGDIQRGCRPLLIEFAAEYCHYCTLIEEEVLKPIRRNRDYDNRVVMRKVMLDGVETINNFDGQAIDPAKLASQYNVYVTPTLIFVDSKGNELAERLVGVPTLEFYGGYLDQSLDLAKQQLEKQGDCQQQRLSATKIDFKQP